MYAGRMAMLRIALPSREAETPRWPGLPDWLCALLSARGVKTEAEARAFLHPDERQLLSPFRLHDMEKAVSLLRDARDQRQRAVIYGDYDVDGVCASAILKDAFDQLGLQAEVYIPDRHQEGYGLNCAAVERLAEAYRVLVTVDCGIVSLAEVALAKEKGMRVIVTDHHRHGDRLPDADAVITPLLGDAPLPALCGAGVAWKLALALLGDRAFPLIGLAGLATVADMVPLLGENRVIAALGLERLSRTERPGLRALMERAGLRGPVSSDQAAFQIAPRMNACGRLESARIALDMLMTKDSVEVAALALRMETLNQRRRSEENRVVGEALRQVADMNLTERHAIVVCGEDWDSGVVGLAAGRIAEKYACPTVALSQTGDLCTGSARSAGNVDIHAALSECADLFERFGGHRQAAGLTLKAEYVDAFARRLSDAVKKQTGGQPILPVLSCDGEMRLSQVTPETAEWLALLEPCGTGNPAPRFWCREARPVSLAGVGAEHRHLRCLLEQEGELRGGICFNAGDLAGRTEGAYQLVFTPTINEYRREKHAECRIHAMELLPETLKKDPDREAVFAFSEPWEEETPPIIGDGELDALMQGGQGTLLLCRCLETALALRGRFPQADFALEKAEDPHAYHTILLYGRSSVSCAPFRQVVCCDGALGEAAAWKRRLPNAQISALPMSPALRRLLSEAFLDGETLRECYKACRRLLPRDLEEAAEAWQVSRRQAVFALLVFGQLGLMKTDFFPFHTEMIPYSEKRSLEQSPLYRAGLKAKEEDRGVHSV